MPLYQGQYRPASPRLPAWDYSAAGYYFVTNCVYRRQSLFGEIQDGAIRLLPIGEVADRFWLEIPAHFPNADLDEYVIMPNHLHGIIIIRHPLDTQHAAHLQDTPDALKHLPASGSPSTIVRSHKSAVTRWARVYGYTQFAWQTRFYDHIIRDDQSLERIRRHIQNNPYNWETDDENPDFHFR